MSNSLFKTPRGRLFVLSGPAGSGKTTLVDRLTKEFPFIKKNISFTTRKKREGEVDGIDYHFVPVEAFEEKEAAGEFLESVNLFGNRYGTSIKTIQAELDSGNHLVLVIDVEGALKVREMLDVPLIFVIPPSIEVLKNRLRGRGSENPSELERRLSRALFEIKQGEDLYDYLFINDDLNVAYDTLKSILVAELHKRKTWKE